MSIDAASKTNTGTCSTSAFCVLALDLGSCRGPCPHAVADPSFTFKFPVFAFLLDSASRVPTRVAVARRGSVVAYASRVCYNFCVRIRDSARERSEVLRADRAELVARALPGILIPITIYDPIGVHGPAPGTQ
jgi:hypothetical protein